MCKKSTYNRFLKLLEYHSNYSCNHVIYNTKLGKRDVYISKKYPNTSCKTILVVYFNGISNYIPELEILFSLNIYPNGKIEVLNSKISQPEIFLAIYEIEQIINNKKYNEKDNILEKLFENIGNENFNFFNFTQYR